MKTKQTAVSKESPSDGKRAVSACSLAKGADAWLCPSVSFTVVRASGYQMAVAGEAAVGRPTLRPRFHSNVAGDSAALLQILLVILLGSPKGACRNDLCRNRFRELMARFEPCNRIACCSFLLR